MAYVDFSGDPVRAAATGAATGAGHHAPAAAEETGLSALEWSVVALARRDRMASLDRPGRMAVALGAVFGTLTHNPRLADPRLEALRRMAVFSWHRGFSVPSSELKAFLRAGFSTSQYETMLGSILAGRSRRNARA